MVDPSSQPPKQLVLRPRASSLGPWFLAFCIFGLAAFFFAAYLLISGGAGNAAGHLVIGLLGLGGLVFASIPWLMLRNVSLVITQDEVIYTGALGTTRRVALSEQGGITEIPAPNGQSYLAVVRKSGGVAIKLTRSVWAKDQIETLTQALGVGQDYVWGLWGVRPADTEPRTQKSVRVVLGLILSLVTILALAGNAVSFFSPH